MKKSFIVAIVMLLLVGCGKNDVYTTSESQQNTKVEISESETIDVVSDIFQNEEEKQGAALIVPNEHSKPVLYKITEKNGLSVDRYSSNGFIALYGPTFELDIPDVYNPIELYEDEFVQGTLPLKDNFFFFLGQGKFAEDEESTKSEPIEMTIGDYQGNIFELFYEYSGYSQVCFEFEHSGDSYIFGYTLTESDSLLESEDIVSGWHMDMARQLLSQLKFYDDYPELGDSFKMNIDEEAICDLAALVGRAIIENEIDYNPNNQESIDSMLEYYILLKGYGREGIALTDDFEYRVDADVMDMCAQALFGGLSGYKYKESQSQGYQRIRYDANENAYYLGFGDGGIGLWIAIPDEATKVVGPSSYQAQFDIYVQDEEGEMDDVFKISILLSVEENTDDKAVEWGLPYKVIGCKRMSMSLNYGEF